MGIPCPLKLSDCAGQAWNRIILATDRSIPTLFGQAGSRISFRGEIPPRSSGSDGGRMGNSRRRKVGELRIVRYIARRRDGSKLLRSTSCPPQHPSLRRRHPHSTKGLWGTCLSAGFACARSSFRNSPRCGMPSCTERVRRRCPTGVTAISIPRSPTITGAGAAAAGFRAPSTAKPTML